ncbi:MAG: hypothetical protein F4Z33_09480, partial [Gemmatimonadales bacterium]|nr:hypothetical protein [Gemmatimonadales bacterium]
MDSRPAAVDRGRGPDPGRRGRSPDERHRIPVLAQQAGDRRVGERGPVPRGLAAVNAAPVHRTRSLLVAGCLLAGLPGVGSVAGGPDPLSAQTPEQRYSDWVRPGFRPQEYEFRRNRILDGLRATGGGLLLVPSSDGITHGETFRQLEDFWYLTGLELPQSMLVLDASRDISILFMPQRDPRFESPGRPNDFPGRPLLEDYQIRGIGGADDYRDIAELDGFLRERVGRSEILRVNAGAAGEVPDPVVPLV